VTDERALAFLGELVRADDEAAVALAELDELAGEVATIRTRAAELEARLAGLPAQRERSDASFVEADRAVVERRTEHERAAAELDEAERARDAERLAARRAEVRARDRVRMAERRAARARAAVDELALESDADTAEAKALVERARTLAAALRERPVVGGRVGAPPDESLEALAEWTTEVRAALFVARGRLAAEREAVIRQANELGAAVLGEPISAQGTALVARRVARAQRP
jgi:chromosome segregation ATPase